MPFFSLSLWSNRIQSAAVAVVLLVILGTWSASSSAQQYTLEEVKAALLIQLVRNAQWPGESRKASINIYVWQDTQLHEAFRPVSQLSVRNKAINVRLADSLEQLENADLLYISESQLPALQSLSFNLRGQGVLIVTEKSPALHNVMINILQREVDESTANLEFQINRPNIAFENIQISPELVLFGGTEIDVAELYHQTELAIQSLREQNQSTFGLLEEQRLAFARKEQEFSQLQALVAKLESEIQAKESSIESNEVILGELVKQIDNVELQYQSARRDLEAKEQELLDAEEDMLKFERNVQDQMIVLEALNDEVEANQQLLEQQKKQLSQAETEVKAQSKLIDRQRGIIFVVLGIVAIAIASAIAITTLYVKNRRTKEQLQATLQTLTEAQAQLVEKEKMASLGGLVAGVAHEINTPLGISLTAITTLGSDSKELKDKIEQGQLSKQGALDFAQRLQELDALIVTNLNRCHQLVESFKQVSADQIVEQRRMVYLKDYCQEIFNILSAYLKQHRITWHISGDNPKHNLDPGLLSQVFNNLCTNAVCHAFKGVEQKSIDVEITYDKKRDRTRIVFSDNGVGINETVRQKIFEPFYTTKRGQGGTGLGLNIVYTIVTTKLHGDISVESEEGKGIRFSIELPTDT